MTDYDADISYGSTRPHTQTSINAVSLFVSRLLTTLLCLKNPKDLKPQNPKPPKKSLEFPAPAALGVVVVAIQMAVVGIVVGWESSSW